MLITNLTTVTKKTDSGGSSLAEWAYRRRYISGWFGRLDCPDELKAEILDDNQEEFVIHPVNVDAWTAFLTVSTQLKFSSTYGALGFDYSGVESGLRMAGITVEQTLFEKLRLIESEVKKQFNQRILQWVKAQSIF